jgi:hypothetical protein
MFFGMLNHAIFFFCIKNANMIELLKVIVVT